MRHLRYLNFILTALTVVLTLNLWQAWASAPEPIEARSVAAQGIPDAGAQRKRMVDLLKKISAQQAAMFNLIASGNVEVKLKNGEVGGE